MKKQPGIRFLLHIAFVFGAGLVARGDDATRIYYLGNSLTDELKYSSFAGLAEAGGEKIVWGRHMIPGCPIRGLWGATGGFQQPPFGYWQQALRDYEWDAVTLQPFCPFQGEYEHALLFAREAIKKSPDARIYIYAQWPDKNRGSDWDKAFSGPAEIPAWAKSDAPTSYANVAATVPDDFKKRFEEASLRNEYELIVLGLRKNVPSSKPAVLIPAGHAMQLLGQKMRAGLVPSYRTPWDLYSDGVHVNNVCSYLVACSYYATIFKKSPGGLPIGEYQAKPGHRDDCAPLSSELARLIQETVWEVVASHPLTGVTSAEPLKVASPVVDPAVAGEPYRFELLSAFGRAPFAWSLAAGALPEGLSLSGQGLVSGTPVRAGNAKPTLQVADAAGRSARKTFEFAVEEDRPPVIPEQAIPAQSVGTFFEYRLTSTGGNGAARWNLKEGSAPPPGVSLDADGRLWGAPGKEGDYACTLEVLDGDPGEPEAAERTFTITVGPASGEIALARRLTEKMELCHWKEEPDPSPWRFRYPIEKLVQGDRATVAGSFDLAWDDTHLWVAVKVKDPTNKPGSRGEAVGGDNTILCIDARNNREATYHADDRYLAFARNCPWPTGAFTGDRFTAACRHKDLEDGYFALYHVSFKSLGFMPETLPSRVIGLDLVLVDDAQDGVPKSMVVWKGTKDNRTDPSRFGTIVLAE